MNPHSDRAPVSLVFLGLFTPGVNHGSLLLFYFGSYPTRVLMVELFEAPTKADHSSTWIGSQAS